MKQWWWGIGEDSGDEGNGYGGMEEVGGDGDDGVGVGNLMMMDEEKE